MSGKTKIHVQLWLDKANSDLKNAEIGVGLSLGA